ncbi:DUF3800 domain-containing protein [Roseburia sp. 1XD42-69]|nr:DUF3800 domain-containing protein [Roseburia sp. 1XD42-69]
MVYYNTNDWGKILMANYFLFLDELKSNNEYNHFCIGGCFIEESYYRDKIVKQINQLKSDIFGNTSIILHESEVLSYKGSYRKFRNEKDKEEKFWRMLGEIYKNNDIHTLCAGVHKENLKKYYPSKNEKDSEYYIALQIILENFVHFLIDQKGTGCVYFESRDIQSDFELYEHYNMIVENGTLFLGSKLMQKHLRCISFPLKLDNNIGLQLADFIPNPVARDFQGMAQRDLNIFTDIKNKAYNGNIDRDDRFGLKKVL